MIGDPNPVVLFIGIFVLLVGVIGLPFGILGKPGAHVVPIAALGGGLGLLVFAHVTEPIFTATFGYQTGSALQVLIAIGLLFSVLYIAGAKS